jgi:hypothetical protein
MIIEKTNCPKFGEQLKEGNSFAKLQVITPENEKYETRWTSKKYEFNYTGDWNPILDVFVGGSGTWQFKVNQIAVNSFWLIQFLQYVRIFGADIRFPETPLGGHGTIPSITLSHSTQLMTGRMFIHDQGKLFEISSNHQKPCGEDDIVLVKKNGT